MEDQDVFDTDGQISTVKKRPAFILVLAILSWIYVGIALVGGLITSLSSEENMQRSLDASIQIYEDMDEKTMPFKYDMIEFMEISKENYKLNNLLQIIFVLIEGLGVFMMFNLKRNGFWVYTLSQIGFLSIYFILFPLGNFLTIASFTIMFLIVLLFEILYAVNLKHMS